MGRRQIDSEPTRWVSTVLLLMGLFSCSLVYTFMSVILRPNEDRNFSSISEAESIELDENGGGCCRGIDSFELWGAAVKWGSDFKFNSSIECCKACKAMCSGEDGPCLCDSWVYCGNRERCGSKFGECWLKKQKDPLAPDRQEAGDKTIWTSGLIYGKGESRRPWSELGFERKSLEICFFWTFIEECPTVQRGLVAWIGSGPEFFISLANHEEWKKTCTVFGYVLPEDMEIAETIATLPTKHEVWNNINVSVLEKPVPLGFRRINKVSRE